MKEEINKLIEQSTRKSYVVEGLVILDIKKFKKELEILLEVENAKGFGDGLDKGLAQGNTEDEREKDRIFREGTQYGRNS